MEQALFRIAKGGGAGSASPSPGLLGTSPVGVPHAVPPMRRSSSVGGAEGPGSAGAALRSPLMGPSPRTPLPEALAPGQKAAGAPARRGGEPAGLPSLVGFSVAQPVPAAHPPARPRGGAVAGGGLAAALVADEEEQRADDGIEQP